MKALLVLCLAVCFTIAVAAAHKQQSSAPRITHRRQSSTPRSFLIYVKEKMTNVGVEITELKEEIDGCCNQEGQ